MALQDQNANHLEYEDDRGQIQQVSGGFGDSQTIDEATLKALMEQQQKAEAIAAMYKPVPLEQWERESQLPDYTMESTMFDYEKLKESDNFGIKKY